MIQRLTAQQVLPFKAKLVIQQKGRCAICRHPITAGEDSCLDHDHKTGAIRSALCRNCNGIEGKVKNLATRAKRDATYQWWVEKLLAYWNAHETHPSSILHPSHKTEAEKRVKRNKKARQRRAQAKGK